MIHLKVFLGYLKRNDELLIVTTNPSTLIRHLKEVAGSEWDYCYVDVWEEEVNQLEFIALGEFEEKYHQTVR